MAIMVNKYQKPTWKCTYFDGRVAEMR